MTEHQCLRENWCDGQNGLQIPIKCLFYGVLFSSKNCRLLSVFMVFVFSCSKNSRLKQKPSQNFRGGRRGGGGNEVSAESGGFTPTF